MAMSSISATLNALRSRGIEVDESNGSLQFSGRLKPTAAELDSLQARKQELLAFIRARKVSPRGRIEIAEATAKPSIAQLLWMRWLGIGTPEEQILSLNASVLLPATDAEAAKRAISRLLELHEALRYRFSIENGTTEVHLNDIDTFRMEHEDISDCTSKAQIQSAFWKMAEAFSEIPIPANGDWLFRAKLVSLSGSATAVLLRINHLVADAASLEIIRSDLILLTRDEGGKRLKSRKQVRYADFAASEQEWYRARGNVLEDYWRTWSASTSTLRSPETADALSWSAGPRTIRKFFLNPALLRIIELKAAEVHATVFLLILTTLARAAARWSNRDEFAIRTLFDRRTTPELRSVVGLLLGADAIRIELERGEPFLSSLNRLKLEFSAVQQVRAPNQYCFPPEVIIPNGHGHFGNVPIVFNCRTSRSHPLPPGATRQSLGPTWPSEPTTIGTENWDRPSAPIVFEFFGFPSHAELHVRLNDKLISSVDQAQLIAEFWQILRAETELCV